MSDSNLVRVSIANLVPVVVVRETGQRHFFGIYNPSGTRLQALGGAAQLTEDGVELLKNQYEAQGFERDAGAALPDARFVVKLQCVEELLRLFEDRHGSKGLFETDPWREIEAELTKPIGDIPPVLPPDMPSEELVFEAALLGTCRQPAPRGGRGTSERERTDVPTRRLFHLFALTVPLSIFDEMSKAPAIRWLTPADLATTMGGSQKGITLDGTPLADNLGLRW